ncbi:MAG TPA: glycosyltransferase family 4 protein [bacterium]
MPVPHPARFRILTAATVDVTVDKFLKGFIAAQLRRGYQAEVACADGPYAAAMRADGFIVHSVAFTRRVVSWRHPVALVQLVRLMRARRYSIVHVHNPVAQVLGRIAARIAGVPLVVYTSHGFQFHESRPRWQRAAILRLERWLGGMTDLVFTQSLEDAETAVVEGLAPASNVRWIGNGIDLAPFRTAGDPIAARRALGLLPDDRVVGFVGRVVREKGVVDLVEALTLVRRAVPGAKLVVIGDTLASDRDRAVTAELRQAIARGGLGDAVVFAGYRDDVPRLLSGLDVFALPSWREGMPRSIIEAMAAGLPVVATDIRGSREEVVSGETGWLVPVGNPARFADALIQLLRHRDQAAAMGAAGRQRAFALFDEQMVFERQFAAYEAAAETVDGRAHRPAAATGP